VQHSRKFYSNSTVRLRVCLAPHFFNNKQKLNTRLFIISTKNYFKLKLGSAPFTKYLGHFFFTGDSNLALCTSHSPLPALPAFECQQSVIGNSSNLREVDQFRSPNPLNQTNTLGRCWRWR